MKVESTKDKLAQAVSQADRVTGKNLTLPVLSCILISAKNNQLTLRSTNLDLGIELTIPVKVDSEGVVAVPGSVLNSLLSGLYKDSPVTLEEKDGNLVVSTSYSKTLVKTLPHEDFPTIPALSKEHSFAISAKDLVRGLRAVWYSASLSSIKPELASVYIYSSGDSLVFVATDSFRLAEKQVALKQPIEIEKLLIPHKNVPEIIRMLEEVGGGVEVTFTANQIAFIAPGAYLTSRIIDGNFPDYRQIIPKETTTEVVVLKQDLSNALKMSNIFADKFNQVNFKVNPAKKVFEITSKNADVGETSDRLSGDFKGENLEINFNYKYVVDCFQSIEAESVILHLSGLNKPMVIQGMGNSSFRYLVMPMNR